MINRRTFPVDMNSPYAVKHMAEYLQKGGRLVLFPEGRLSCTGSLMKLFDGTGFLIFKTRAKVITAYIRGARPPAVLAEPGPEAMVPAPVGALQRRAHRRPSSTMSAPPRRARGSPTGCATRWSGSGSRPRWHSARPPCRRPFVETRAAGPGKSSCKTSPAGAHLSPRLLVGADLLAAQWRSAVEPIPSRASACCCRT